jgi:hypothetical protein
MTLEEYTRRYKNFVRHEVRQRLGKTEKKPSGHYREQIQDDPEELALWVQNDEALYNAARRKGVDV